MWTIGLLCKCHVICQLFTFFHFAFDIQLMETVMLNNHDSNIFCPHIPGRKLDNFSIVFKTLQLSFCSFSTYLSFEQLGEIIVRVAEVSISLMSTVLSTFPVKQNKHCEMKLGICSQNNNSGTYMCILLKRGTYLYIGGC